MITSPIFSVAALNLIFQLGMELTPETVSNWSLTQDSHFKDQMEAGFRERYRGKPP